MEPKRRIGIGALILIAVIAAALGGGLVGGVTGYRLARLTDPTPQVLQLPSAQTPSSAPSSITSDPIVEVVKKASPAVVTVLNTLDQRTVFGSNQATGSGVIISDDGYIVTNEHVVESATRLQVIFADGSIHEAHLIGTDTFSDLAVVKVDDAVPAVASFGDSDALQPGQLVIAIGSPLGTYKNSVTTGVVSALNRSVTPAPGRTMEGLIQTDAAINHGNSGGPLINLNGEVIGINTLVVRGRGTLDPTDIAQGLGFAVPSNTVKLVAEQLIRQGYVERPYLGIEYEMITRELAATESLPVQEGARVTRVPVGTAAEGPAARAGILEGDIIIAINGEKVTEQQTLRQLLMQHKVGDTVTITVLRNGQETDVPLTLAPRPSEEELQER